MGAGPDRRSELARVGALGPVRQQPRRQHRLQPLGVQARTGRVEGGGALDVGGHGRRDPVTDNDDFYGGSTRSQAPLYALQGHAIYSFRSGIWGSLDATYYSGGRSTIDGTRNRDLQQNWRIGATLSFPVDRNNSVKAYASSGVSARTGNNFDLLGIAWQYRWGGGLESLPRQSLWCTGGVSRLRQSTYGISVTAAISR